MDEDIVQSLANLYLDFMNISRKTFYKYVDTGNSYLDYYYYTKPLNN